MRPHASAWRLPLRCVWTVRPRGRRRPIVCRPVRVARASRQRASRPGGRTACEAAALQCVSAGRCPPVAPLLSRRVAPAATRAALARCSAPLPGARRAAERVARSALPRPSCTGSRAALTAALRLLSVAHQENEVQLLCSFVMIIAD